MHTRSIIVILAAVLATPSLALGQASGNIGFAQGGGKARAEQAEKVRRVLTQHELPPTNTTTFVEASVLMNVKADEYVAVFGIARDGKTVPECSEKMAATSKQVSDDLKKIGLGDDRLFVDFVAQNKIYGYEITGDIAREKLVGFELKKNLLIHYQDPAVLDKLVTTAARSEVFDLIKVDYIVKDLKRVHDRLMEEAAETIKHKRSRYEKLLDVKLHGPAQVYAERSGVHYPTGMYDSYTAQDTEEIGVPFDRQRHLIQGARKSRTFFFNGLDADGFDEVVNPVVTEPVVQFTLYLKVKYEVEQAKAK